MKYDVTTEKRGDDTYRLYRRCTDHPSVHRVLTHVEHSEIHGRCGVPVGSTFGAESMDRESGLQITFLTGLLVNPYENY